MKRIVLLGLVLVFGLLKLSQALSADDYKLKVMSFNVRIAITEEDTINSWKYRKSILINTINRNLPDVIGVQESYPSVVEIILDSCEGYSAYGKSRDGFETAGSESCHILYKTDLFIIDEQNSGTFWYSETPDIEASKDPSALYRRICTYVRLVNKATGKAFYIYNSHWDNDSEEARDRSAVLLEKRINSRMFPNDPFIVMGDLNATETENSINYLKEANDTNLILMNDTYRLIYPDVSANDGFTKHHFDGVGYKKIDYILVEQDGGIETLGASVEEYNENGHYPSDHFPVLASLSLDTTTASFTIESKEEIVNQEENDKKILVKVLNDTFEQNLNSDNWIMVGFEEGVEIGSINRIDSANAIITLSGNANIINNKWSSLKLSIAPSELNSSIDTLHQNVGVKILPAANSIPGYIEGESYYYQEGFDIVNCEDIDGGENILSNMKLFSVLYKINVASSGHYTLTNRISSTYVDGAIEISVDSLIIDTIGIHRTNDIQNWANVYAYIFLNEGEHYLSYRIIKGEGRKIGINWINVEAGNVIPNLKIDSSYTVSETEVNVVFDRLIKEPENDINGFKISANGIDLSIEKISILKNYKHIISLELNEKLNYVDDIVLNYRNGNMQGFNDTFLDDINNFEVTNMLEQGLDVNESLNLNFKIYPNPIKDKLSIQLNQNNGKTYVVIYDILGNNIYQKIHESKLINIDVSMLKSGTYVVNIYNGSLYHKQLIVK